MKFKGINIGLTSFLIFVVNLLQAQGPPVPPPDSTSGSIDKGAIILLVAVAILGYRQLKQNKSEIPGT